MSLVMFDDDIGVKLKKLNCLYGFITKSFFFQLNC